MTHLLLSGAAAHEFTSEERSLGGVRTKFNHVTHGRYAKKLSQAYACPKCGEAIPAGRILEQDAVIMKLTSKREILEEVKRNLVTMQALSEEEEEAPRRFFMQLKLTELFLKLYEKHEEQVEEREDDLTMRQLLDRICALDDKKEVVSNESPSETNNLT